VEQDEMATPVARKKKTRRRVPPALLRRAAAARYCGAGVSTWDRWAAAGLTPAAVKIGGAVCWSRHELAAWCPPRSVWQPLWKAILTTRRTGRSK